MRRHSPRSGGDAGNAQIVLLLAMVGAVFLSLIVIKVGHVDDMRSRAQRAADAAALATLQPMRKAAIGMAMRWAAGPETAGYWLGDGKQNAENYAERNRGVLKGKPHITGLFGHTAKVEVRTRDCQLIPEDQLTEQQKRDLRDPNKLCTDNSGNSGIGRHAHAIAIAQFKPPTCTYENDFVGDITDGNASVMYLVCDDTRIASTAGWNIGWGAISRMFEVRLVDKEDSTPYGGGLGLGPPVFGGPVPAVPPGTPEQLAKILEFVRAQVGKPYCWGGTGMACFDCSGLLYRAFASVGIAIARVSFDQWKYPRVPNGQEKAGDFVFFNSGPNSGPGRPGHVGIVIDPEKKIMIDAACTACKPGIRAESYQRSTLMGFTRPFRVRGET